jgi:hypothetical protein
MGTLVFIILILLILCGLGYGGGLYGGGPNRYWGPGAVPGYNIGGLIALIIVVVLFLMLFGVIGGHHTGAYP